jgi:Flp pilus assembly pilin Flp
MKAAIPPFLARASGISVVDWGIIVVAFSVAIFTIASALSHSL